jgi:tetratricopeptide (TPR) repeat protein
MAPAPLRADDSRHPWLKEFEQSPAKAFGDLLSGYARVHPYERADAPDAARMVFGPLALDDPAWKALGPAIVAWLQERRRKPLSANPHRLQRFVREVCEAFEIVALLSVAEAAVELRRAFIAWNEWVTRLVLSASRDARAEYWRMLALTQPLVADTSSIEPHGLAPFWLKVCSESGGRLPSRYLTIGLLGLRRLPGAPLDGTETPWLAGLAHWALAQKPSSETFLAEWRPLKQLYPRAPTRWRRYVGGVLTAKQFKHAGIEPPAWWEADPDFRSMVSGDDDAVRKQRTTVPLSPVPKEAWEPVIKAIERDEDFAKLGPRIDGILSKQRHYAEGTGDSYFLVRTFTNIGMRLIQHGSDARAERARTAQELAKEALEWEPHDVFAWSLWRDALAEEGALEAAELVGWEFVRRVPDDPQPRTQLADFLANRLGRGDEAEAVYRETIQRFPGAVHARTQLADLIAKQPDRGREAEEVHRETIDRFPENAHARNQLAELLIAEDRVADAEAVVAAAIVSEAFNAVTYAIQARLRSHAGDEEGARRAVAEGLRIDTGNIFPRHFESLLNTGRKLPLVSRAFRPDEFAATGVATSAAPEDPTLASAVARGRARRLGFQLESANEKVRAAAQAEVKRLLEEESAFAYAELLAARQRLCKAEDPLPPVAVAFEAALASEDRQRLEALAERMPRLEALFVVARAVLGDDEAAGRVESWLRSGAEHSEEPAVTALRALMRPVLRVIEGGKSAGVAIAECRADVVHALHDANEATLGDALLAA